MANPGQRGRVFVICAAAAALWPSVAAADDGNYQSFVVGGRAMVLGGAFTSIADDASGIYFNPAGIVDAKYDNAQLSTSLYGFERQTISRPGQKSLTLPVPGVEDLNPEFTELIIVPGSAGFVQRFGDKGADETPLNAFGLSVVVPSFRSFTVDNPNGGTQIASTTLLTQREPFYRRRVTDRSLWAGAGYSRKLTRRLKVGLSGYYILRSLSDLEEVAVEADVAGTDSQVFRTASNEISILNGNLAFALGAKYQLTDRISLGLTVQAPSFGIHSEADLNLTLGESVPECTDPFRCSEEPIFADGPRSEFDSFSISGADSETDHPGIIRFGASFVQPYQFTISVDGTLYFAVDYTMVKGVEPEVLARLPFNPQIDRLPVFNVNVGAEYLIIREVSVAGGFYTDFSSSRKIPSQPTIDQPARNNLFGVTLSLGYFGKHTLSRIGVLYSVGNGQDVIPVSDIGRLLEDQQAFQRVDFFQSFFYFYVSSTFRY